MRLEWRDDGLSGRTRRRNRTKELHVIGDPDSDGDVPYSYVGFVKRYAPTGKDPEWLVYIHEFETNPYWAGLEDLRFKSRSSAMREMRKRFTVAWIAATPEEREHIWDGRE